MIWSGGNALKMGRMARNTHTKKGLYGEVLFFNTVLKDNKHS